MADLVGPACLTWERVKGARKETFSCAARAAGWLRYVDILHPSLFKCVQHHALRRNLFFFQLFAFVFSCHPSWVLKLIIVSIFFAFVVPYFYLCQFRVNSYQNMLFSILVGGSQSYFFNPSQLFSILTFFLNTSRFPSPFSLDVIHSFNLIGTFSSMFNSCCKI